MVAAAVVLLGGVPRLLAAAGALPAWLAPFVWSDVLYTWERGLAGGRLPYWDSYFEYPPLDGYLSALFSALGPSALGYVALWLVVQAGAAAAIATWLAGSGRRMWWAWALLPQLALFGPINFDLLAVAGLVLAVRWERAHRPLRAVAALAAGTAAKLFPLAALPVLLLRAPFAGRRAAAARIAVFAVLLAACYAPAVGAPFTSIESVVRYSVGVGANFDSVWGLVAGGLEGIGIPAALPILAVTTLGLVATYLAAVVPAARSARDPAAPVALAVLTVLLWSRLYSPQFSLWALPFFALVPLPGRALALLTAADVAVFLTVYPLTLVPWTGDELARSLLLAALAAAIVARHAALVMSWVAARHLALRPATTP